MNLTPHRIPSLLPKLFPGLIWHVPDREKSIYVTFDDGPVPGPTEFVLETLNEFKAKATFFCIGDNVRRHSEVFTKIMSAGHSIGNHTFNHLSGWSASNKVYVDNVKLCDEQFNSMGSKPSLLFRPPYGRIRPNQTKSLNQYKIVMWDVLSLDYQQSGKNENYLQGTIDATRAGSIVVFHDSYKAEKKLKFILPRFLEHFSSNGFHFKTL